MSEPHPPHGGIETNSNPRKRRRTAIACKHCSARKSRCDGKEPKCTTCVDLAADCIYPRPARQSQGRSIIPCPQISNIELQERLQNMEENMKELKDLLPDLRRIVTTNEPTVSMASEGHAHHVAEDIYTLPSPPKDRVDGMGIMLSKDDNNEDEDVGYFGASSNITLLRKVTRVCVHSQILNSTDPASWRNLDITHHLTPSRLSTRQSNRPLRTRPEASSSMYQIPDLAKGKSLIRQFFGTVGLMLPCFHEPRFVDFLQEASLNGTRTASKAMLAILNVMFALGKSVATTSSPPHESVTAEESTMYYGRAIALMGNAFDPSSLETVQLSLILSTYLMGTQDSVKSWSFHTLAVGGAFKIGLHSRHAGRSLSLLAKEMRKRAWFWCVVNDRLLSMLFGRSPLIHPTLVNMDLPVNIADEFPSPSVSSLVMQSMVDHYSAIINLAVLMGDVVERLYNQNLSWDVETSPEKLLASNLDVVWKLGEWRNALPQELRPISAYEISGCSITQSVDQLRLRIFLTLRYKSVQILANRAILFKYMAYRPGSDADDRELRLLQTSGQCLLQACREDCIELIQLVSVLVFPAKEFENVTLCGAWNYTSYHVFNSALALLGILLVCRDTNFSNLFSSHVTLGVRKALDEACNVLDSLHNGNPMILRCAECLPRLIRMYESIGEEQPTSLIGMGTFTNTLHQYMQHPALENDLTAVAGLEEADFNIDLGLSSGGLGMNADFDFINDLFETISH